MWFAWAFFLYEKAQGLDVLGAEASQDACARKLTRGNVGQSHGVNTGKKALANVGAQIGH
jgi:hypothetical protein